MLYPSQEWVCRHGCIYTGEAVAHNLSAHREEYEQECATTDRVVLTWRRGAWWWFRVSPADIVLSQAGEGHASQQVTRDEATRVNARPFLLEVH